MPGSPSSKIVCASEAPTARSAPVSRQTSRPSIQVLARPTMAAHARPSTARSHSAATRPALKVHSARTLSHLTKGAIPTSLIEAPRKKHVPCTHFSTSSSGTARSSLLYGTRALPEQTGADNLLCRISVDLAQLKGDPQKLEAVRQRLTPRQPLTLALRSRVEALKSQLHTKDARIAELEATLHGSRSTTASNHSSTTSGPCSPTGEDDASSEAEAEAVPSCQAPVGQATRAEAEGSSHGAHEEERDEALDEDCDRLLSMASWVLDFDVCAAPPPPPAPPAPPPAPPARPQAPPPPPIATVHPIKSDAPCTQAPSPAILSTPLSWEAPVTAPALASPAMTSRPRSPRSPCRTPREDRVFDYFAGQAYGRTSFIVEVFAEERARREAEEAEAEAARASAAERRAIAEAASERLAAPRQRRVQPLSSAAFERRTRDAEKARPEAALDFVRIPEKRERYKTPATRAAEAKAAAAAQVQAEGAEHSPRCSREPLSARPVVVSIEEQDQSEGNETEDDEEEIERRRSEQLLIRRLL